MTYSETTRTWIDSNGAHWLRVRNGHGQTTGWLEVFGSRRAGFVSVPGASRWLDA